MSEKLQAARSRIRDWRENPVKFVWDNFKTDPDKWQVKVLDAFASQDKDKQRISMQACAGPGKSAALAWCGWNFLSCYGGRGDHPKGAVVATTKDNLKDNLWPELSKWQNRSDYLKESFTWTKERIYANDFAEDWFLSARSWSKTADAEEQGRTLSGLHSGYVLAMVDESGDIPVAVLKAGEQALSNCKFGKILQAGNPTSKSGMLYAASHTLKNWYVVRITGDPDDPDRSPRIDKEWAREQIEQWGIEDPWVMSYILGKFPLSAINSLLTPEEVDLAFSRHYRIEQYQHAAKILGVDVAREGMDSSVLTRRQGLVMSPQVKYRGLTSFPLANNIIVNHRDWNGDGIIVDGTGGYGSGVIDALRAMQVDAFDCQFASAAQNPMKFYNMRAQIIWDACQWVKSGGAMPPCPKLKKQMTGLTYSFKGNRIIMEPKDSYKARNNGESPDELDSLAVTFAFPIQKRVHHPGHQANQAMTSWNPLG
jgi:phage terminase large subunit